MRVILSGMNVDIEKLDDYKRRAREVKSLLESHDAAAIDRAADFLDEFARSEDLTPETLSAGYARISRDPRPVDEIRRDAAREVERARRSNKTIIFGMGHSSVAEHAVFNLDIIGVSRLATEALQQTRLASYTEKSQRYITLEGDYLVPEEIGTIGLSGRFAETVSALNRAYTALNEGLCALMEQKYPERWADPKRRGVLEGYAKEDARYVMPLATLSQMGMTANSRVIEMTIRRLSANRLSEVRELAQSIYDAVSPHAPSVIRYITPTPYDTRTEGETAEIVRAISPARPLDTGKGSAPAVNLVDWTPDGDERLIAALLFRHGSNDFSTCRKLAREIPPRQKERLIDGTFAHMEAYDRVLREFETITLTYEATVSASNFAQLKRHRMATIIAQDYDVRLGVEIPRSVREAGLSDVLAAATDKAETLYDEILKRDHRAAPYILTNAHKRRVLVSLNLRELYHIARLRMDAEAQWDIRALAGAMADAARGVLPLTARLLVGKDAFHETKGQPGVTPG